MTHLLAQGGGGGGGGWINPATVKIGLYLLFGLFVLLGGVFKKIAEQNAKRAAERARERRTEEILRTGRDESGAFVSPTRSPAGVPAAAASAEDAARRRAQEQAERRQRELAEMMRRAAQQQQQRARQPQQRPPQQSSPKTKGKQQSRKSTPPPPTRTEPSMPAMPANVGPGTLVPERARHQPLDAVSPVPAATPHAASGRVGAALERLGGVKSGPGADWKRAFVLGELLQRPMSMRDRE